MNQPLPLNHSSLFDMLDLVQRPIPEQRQFEIEYFELLSSLPSIIVEAFNISTAAKKRKPPLSMNRNWFANEMSGNVLYLVAESFPYLVKYTGRGSYCLMLNYKYECYIKKLTKRKLFPMYNHSKTSRRLTNQKALRQEEPIPIIYIGWTINDTNDNILGFHAVCIKGQERIWHTDLTAIRKPIQTEITSTEKENTGGQVFVTIKDKRKAK